MGKLVVYNIDRAVRETFIFVQIGVFCKTEILEMKHHG